VIGVEDELRTLAGEVGDVSLEPGQAAGFGLQIAIDALGRPGQLDEPVAFDRGFPIDGPFGLGDLLIGNAAGLLGAGGRPRLGEEKMCPSPMSWPGCC
jgi:hypothetical protein